MVRTDIDGGWAWVVMGASFLTISVLGAMNLSSGLIHVAMLEKYGRDNATTALVGGLHTAIMLLAGPLSSILVEKVSCRASVITCGVLFTIGYLGTAYAPSLEVSIVTCGIIAGLGGGFGWTSSMVVTGFYFRRYRNLAQGFSNAGAGAGIFAVAPLIQISRDAFGILGYFIAMASVSIHVIVFGMLMKPSSLEKTTQRERICETRRLQDTTQKSCIFFRNYCSVILCRAVVCLSLSMFMFGFGVFSIFQYLPNYAIHKGSSPMEASMLLSACGLASVFGRTLTGIAANSVDVDELLLHSASMGILGIASLLFPMFSHTYSGQLAFAVILGCYFGCTYCVISTINSQYVGVKNMTSALGIELCLCGMGSMIGPIISGFLLDATGSYEKIFGLAGFSLILAGFLGLSTTLFSERHLDYTTHADTEIAVGKEQFDPDLPVSTLEHSGETEDGLQETEPLKE